MKKLFLISVVSAAWLLPITPAHAALPPTPGVAFVNQYALYSLDEPTASRAAYIGGPLTANRLDVWVSVPNERIVTFEQPTTLMVPGPIETVEKVLFEELPSLLFELDPGPLPDTPTYQDCDYGLGLATCRVPGECNIAVVTRLAGETIVLRHDPSVVSTGAGPCRVAINSERGNDVIDSRDGVPTTVVCDGGIDRVLADAGDAVAGDCEIVSRS
jgi:hypothetical protein